MTTNHATISQNDRSHDEIVGERIAMLMFRHRVTQTALSRSLGMTQPALGKKLRGERKWSLDDLYAVARELGVTISELLGENYKTPPTPKSEGVNTQAMD